MTAFGIEPIPAHDPSIDCPHRPWPSRKSPAIWRYGRLRSTMTGPKPAPFAASPSARLGRQSWEAGVQDTVPGGTVSHATGRRIRGGIVLIHRGRLAVIERRRAGTTYFLFPGGGCEAGETPQAAAVREGFEELGLHLRLTGLTAVVTFKDSEQHYFAAAIIGGRFGTGTGPEMSSSVSSAGGSHRPTWLELDRLNGVDLRPAALRDCLAGTAADARRRVTELIETPVRIREG
ncbi:MAG: NUDIX domain-containing protein [Mycobacteriales bacterium]